MKNRADSGASRREFLKALAAAGMIPLGGTASGLLAQAVSSKLKPNRIDVHHHILPPIYLSSSWDRISASADPPLYPQLKSWTPAKAIEEMDKNGVATAVVSISTPGVWFGEAPAARTLARACNEYAAQMVKDNRGRFGMFAAVPLPDQDGSLREIEYALDVLQADGIGLLTSYGDKWTGDASYVPVFEELNRRKAVVYVHPTVADCCRNLIPGIPNSSVEYYFDTTRAITSLLAGGTFARFRNIRFIFSHAGGATTVLADRMSGFFQRHKEFAEQVPNGASYELKRLHYDIASSTNPSSLAALRNLIPTSQILFGSDFPYVALNVTAHGLDNSAVATSDLQAINRGNAERLFPRLKG